MITLNPAVVREHGEYPAVLYDYLQDKMMENGSYADRYHMRKGISWVPHLAVSTIRDELPVFPDSKSVKRAAERLSIAGLLLTDATGAFLEEKLRTGKEYGKLGRKRDIATWWHVSREHVARKDVPSEFFDRSQRIAFDVDEAKQWGIPYALILGYWRAQKPSHEVEGFKVLSPAEMAKVLPGQEQAIARQVKAMVKAGLLLPHAKEKKHRKLYILPSEVKKLKRQPTWAELQKGKIG